MSSNFTKLYTTQGDTLSLDVVINDDGSPQTPIDLTGATFSGSIRTEYNTDVITTFDIAETDLSNGNITVSLTPAKTSLLTISGKNMKRTFVFDIQYTLSGSVYTFISGHLVVNRQVTT